MTIRTALVTVAIGALLGGIFSLSSVLSAPPPACQSCACKEAVVVRNCGGTTTPVGLRDVSGSTTVPVRHTFDDPSWGRWSANCDTGPTISIKNLDKYEYTNVVPACTPGGTTPGTDVCNYALTDNSIPTKSQQSLGWRTCTAAFAGD